VGNELDHDIHPDSLRVLELRQYTLHPGARDTLVQLFDEHFVESQEALGMRVLGQFRDAGDPARFVWIRGFADMESRRRGLEGFYTGPVWMEHREAANATMIDSDNVLLLRPAGDGAGFPLPNGRPANGDPERPGGVLTATLYSFAHAVDPGFPAWFAADVVPVLEKAGATVLARLVTEPAPNTFPRLPVREGENVFVWFAVYPDAAAHGAFLRRLESMPEWRTVLAPRLRSLTQGASEHLTLLPTRRSALRFQARAW
jgi:NIPSNAP